MTQTTDPYQILGVSATATPGEIKTAYRNLAKLYYPDSSNTIGDPAKLAAVRDAYAFLSNPERRKSFNNALAARLADQRRKDQAARRNQTLDAYMQVDEYTYRPIVILRFLVDRFLMNQGINLAADMMAVFRLYEAAEKAQLELFTQEEVKVILPFITADEFGPKHLDVLVSRSALDEFKLFNEATVITDIQVERKIGRLFKFILFNLLADTLDPDVVEKQLRLLISEARPPTQPVQT